MRRTLAPAWSSAAIVDSLPVAGPMVATIFVRRICGVPFEWLSTNARAVRGVEN